MKPDDDLAALLPEAPPPDRHRRTRAIDLAMERFDARASERAPVAPRPVDRSVPWWSSLGRPYAGALAAAACLALVGLPAAWNALSDRGVIGNSEPVGPADRADHVRPPAGAVGVGPDQAEPPTTTSGRSGSPTAPAPPAPITITPPTAVTPPDTTAPAAPPPMSVLAERSESPLEDSADQAVVVTGSRIRQPNLESAAPLAIASEEAPTAMARTAAKPGARGEWNACTVDDPARSLSACRPLIDPATEGPGGRAAAHLADGLTRAWAGDLDAAAQAFGRAIQAAPQSSLAYINRGLAYRRAGRLDRALADLDRAVQADPRSARAYYQRGLIHRQRGDAGRAGADFDRAIALNPTYAAVAR